MKPTAEQLERARKYIELNFRHARVWSVEDGTNVCGQVGGLAAMYGEVTCPMCKLALDAASAEMVDSKK